MGRFTGLLGIGRDSGRRLAVLARTSAHIKLRIIAWGLGLQFAFAVLVLKTAFGKVFQAVSDGVAAMLGYRRGRHALSCSATRWARSSGPWASSSPSRCCRSSSSSRRSFRFSTTSASCRGGARRWPSAMQKIMGASGAESLNVAASIFMGQTEAPLTIRPFHRGHDGIGTVHHHGQRHGARFGRGDGGLRDDRRMSRSSIC